MQLTHTFEVPAPPDVAWAVLTDIERVGPCMPGATIDAVEGDEFAGSVTVKVGPMRLTYRGRAQFTERDDAARTATIAASGRETRSAGTAKATVHARLAPSGDGSVVTLTTDLNVTGRPAQFGRGVLNDVGRKLVDQFAAALAADLAVAPAAAPAAQLAATSQTTPPEPEGGSAHAGIPAVDVLEAAWGPVLRRVLPILVAVVLINAVLRRARRR